jgi:hypothetical protein
MVMGDMYPRGRQVQVIQKTLVFGILVNPTDVLSFESLNGLLLDGNALSDEDVEVRGVIFTAKEHLASRLDGVIKNGRFILLALGTVQVEFMTCSETRLVTTGLILTESEIQALLQRPTITPFKKT